MLVPNMQRDKISSFPECNQLKWLVYQQQHDQSGHAWFIIICKINKLWQLVKNSLGIHTFLDPRLYIKFLPTSSTDTSEKIR